MSRNGVLEFLLLNVLFLVTLAVGKSISRAVDKEVSKSDPAKEDDGQDTRIPFTLEETYDQSFRSLNFNGTWTSDREILYSDKYTGDIFEFDVTTGKRKLLLDVSIMTPYGEPFLSFSHDNSYILLAYDFIPGFRHSMYKKYVIYDTKRKTFDELANGTHIPLATWSPSVNALAYVLDNDIYYKNLENGKEVRRLTYTGSLETVFNGIPDWVYEEEVLAAASANWFSPDGRHLAFATYNDTRVKDNTFLYYGKPGSLEDQYPSKVSIKYPKAGSPNPIVSLSVVDLTDQSSKLVDLKAPSDIIGTDKILYTVSWWDENRLVAVWSNRIQNKAQWVVYDTKGVASNILHEEEKEGWLRIQQVPWYSGESIVTLKIQDSGTEAGRFLHVTRLDLVDGKLTKETDLTPGASEVHSILAVDRAREKVYYLATGLGEPSQRNLYSVQLNATRKPVCLSCSLVTPEGNPCTYATASFSLDKSYYALSCSGPDPMSIGIFDIDNRLLMSWEENLYLRELLAARKHPIVKDLYVKANGYDSKVRLLLPPDFDEKKSYPLLINVYAGPNTVRITEAASSGFHSYMTTNRSVIYGFIDGRGSAYRGSKMLYEIYRRMGSVEVEDQIAVTETLQKNYSWIDANKTGIWGWSYGGFTTGMVLATDKKSIFKCGISVAPVTSWIYYDSIYTERFMGLPTPEDNLRGYNKTDITRRAEGFRGKMFMLIHGTADDNVHYQQAMSLNKALVEKDIMFEQQTYTDEAHSLSGVSPHLYHTMDRFWGNCMDLARAQ